LIRYLTLNKVQSIVHCFI